MKTDQIISKIQKQIKKNLADASEAEMLDYLEELSTSAYSKKIYSRIESSKQAGKGIVLIHYSLIFDEDLRVENVDAVKWLNSLLERNSKTKELDIYIYSPKFKNTDFIEFAAGDLKEYGLDKQYVNDVNFSGSFIDGSVFVYDKCYIYQGKLPDNDTLLQIHKR